MGLRAHSPEAWAACPGFRRHHIAACCCLRLLDPHPTFTESPPRWSTPRSCHETVLIQYMEFVTPEGLRRDGRRPKELRQLKCEVGVFPHADGSATFNIGNTQVIATVFGPRVADSRGESSTDRAIVKCAYSEAHFAAGSRRQRKGRGDRRTAELASTVRNALEETVLVELFPKAQIDLGIQVLQADGSVLAACINAAMLAVADAGIPMRDMIAASTVGYLESTPLLDINHTEKTGNGPELLLAMHVNQDKAIIITEEGAVNPETLEGMAELAEQGCKAVGKFLRQSLLEHIQRHAVVRGLTVK